MKTNDSGLVTTTLLVLAGFALTAPTPQNLISATVSDVDMRRWELPSNIKYLHLPQNVEVEINNGDGDGNTTVIKGSGNGSGNGSHKKGKGSKSQREQHRRALTKVQNNGDGSGNSGISSVSINKNAGNNAHNTDSHNRADSHNSHDSHNNQVSTSIDVPIFRRSKMPFDLKLVTVAFASRSRIWARI